MMRMWMLPERANKSSFVIWRWLSSGSSMVSSYLHENEGICLYKILWHSGRLGNRPIQEAEGLLTGHLEQKMASNKDA